MTTKTKTKAYSFSEISCYQQCSLKHKLRYIEKIESEYVDQALVLGSCCHVAIETCLKKYQLTDKLMNIIELQQTFTDSLKYQAKEKKIEYKPGWSYDKLNRMGMNMLSFWLRSFKRNYGAIIRMEIEKSFNVPLIDPEANDYSCHNVKGTIDAIFRMETAPRNYYSEPGESEDRFICQHKYVIIDWKTYLNTPNAVTLERCLQNAIYKFCANQAGYIPDLNSTACYLGVLHKKKTPVFRTYPTPVTNDLIRQALKIFNDTILLIELEIAIPNFSMFCANCEYYDNLCQTAY